jgi:hypothetical protein
VLSAPEGSTWSSGKRIDFTSTIGPESAVRCAYLKLLQRRLGLGTRATPPKEPDERGIGVLPDVALLHESGTAFGASSGVDCPTRPGGEDAPEVDLVPGLDLSFPVHVSSLRDAYEEMDRRMPPEVGIARSTSLGVSLQEARRPLDSPEPSTRSVYAQDLALTNLLQLVSQRNIRHVGIQATDVGDAIFLARKLRDVSPDVRVAFLNADVLAMHRTFARELEGSLVVSPYPFLGTSGLGRDLERPTERYDAFENTAAVGTFNAMLAARGAHTTQLRDYVFGQSGAVLPVWTAVLASGRAFPISVTPNRDVDRSLFRRAGEPKEAPNDNPPAIAPAQTALKELDCKRPLTVDEQTSDVYEVRRWRRKRLLECPLVPSSSVVTVPRSWHLTFGVLGLAVAADWAFRRRGLSKQSRVTLADVVPPSESAVELAIVRVKWRLYAALRSCALAFPLGYMAFTDVVATGVYVNDAEGAPLSATSLTLAVGGLGAALGIASLGALAAARAMRDFARDFMELRRYVRDRTRWGGGAGQLAIVPAWEPTPPEGWLRDEHTPETRRPSGQERAS